MNSEISSNRVDIWHALSDLYLDNEIGEVEYKHIARQLIVSGYSVLEIEQILFEEVHPVLYINFKSVAGEWSGFGREFVEEAITEYLKKTQRSGILKTIKQKFKNIDVARFNGFVSPHWNAIKSIMAEGE